jgi:predicted metal-dependent hydrolase
VTKTAERTIPVRRVDIDFESASIPRHYMADGMVASHVVTVLSCLFPSGEDFFVDSVRHYRDRVTDPELRRQVNAFVGQEAIHSREHRAVNDALGRLG